MSLAPGVRLGPYEVTALLGRGGMGEVWRATDTNLGRSVAIKVLPDALAHDTDRLGRFEREAKTLASLNHPNIAIVHGLEKADGARALVMEVVEGPTLADRIATGPLPLTEALDIAAQIIAGLEAAHGQGIIHRDLKPSNIKVRPDGTVKILDFGLAKALDRTQGASVADAREISDSPTVTSPAMTQAGMILGTAAYMSPEQARGRPVDRRADIWAFGCVLFEMLSAHRVFDDEDNSLTLSKVLQREPAWEKLPSHLPPHVRRVIELCLIKDPKRRIADVQDVKLALDGAFETRAPSIVSSEGATPASWRGRIALGAISILLGAVAAGTSVWLTLRPTPPSLTRLVIPATGATALVRGGGSRDVAMAPDGVRIAYRGRDQIFLRALDSLQATPLLSGGSGAASPFFSPDGRWVGFTREGQLRKVAISGGAAVPLTSLDGLLRGASWGAGNTIVFGTNEETTGLARVSGDGGKAVAITTPDPARGEEDHLWPEFLPDGRGVLFTITAASGGLDAARIALVDIDTGQRLEFPIRGTHARYVPSGHLVYAAAGAVQAVRFNLAERSIVGPPAAVLTPAPLIVSGALQLDVATNGTLTYLPPQEAEHGTRTLVWVDRKGQEAPVGGVPPGPYRHPMLSPDGTRIVLSDAGQDADLWVVNLSPTTMYRMTDDAGNAQTPAWLADGRVVFASSRSGTYSLYAQSADGSGQATRLLAGPHLQFGPTSTPDGGGVVFTELTSTGRGDIKLFIHKTQEVIALVDTRFDERGGAVSPDGRWLAYESNRSGRFEVYVQPFPSSGAGSVVPVSTDGGVQPRWGPGGTELFYVAPDGAIMSVAVEARASAWTAGTPVRLFHGRYSTRTDQLTTVAPQFDTRDGQRFLMLKDETPDADRSASSEIVVVQHWLDELERMVPAR